MDIQPCWEIWWTHCLMWPSASSVSNVVADRWWEECGGYVPAKWFYQGQAEKRDKMRERGRFTMINLLYNALGSASMLCIYSWCAIHFTHECTPRTGKISRNPLHITIITALPVCIHSYKLPSTFLTTLQLLSPFVSLSSSPQVGAATLHESSGSRYSLMTSFFHIFYHPHYPKSCSTDSLSHLASSPQLVGCISPHHHHHCSSAQARTWSHTCADTATFTLESKPKPATGSAARTCPHTSTWRKPF